MSTVSAFQGFKLNDQWHWQHGEKARMAAHIASLKDGPWEFPPARRLTRSMRANAYYWSQVATVLAKENEETPDEFHDAMCQMFLPNDLKRIEFFNRLSGEVLQVTIDKRRSSKLTGQAFYDFVERVRLFGVEFLNTTTEDPDPEYWRKKKASAA